MTTKSLPIASDPTEAVAELRRASMDAPTVVFKASPICPVSHAAQRRFKDWLADLPEDSDLQVAVIDVIAERPLARGLVAELGVQHESPQALWFRGGELVWHDSHQALDAAAFTRQLQA